MRAKLFPIVLGSALIAAAIAFYIGTKSGGARSDPEREASAEHGVGRSDPRGPEPSRSSAPVAAGSTERTGVSADDPSTAAAPDGVLVEITILREDTRQPVPKAEVSWWPTPLALDGEDGFEGWLRRGTVD